MAIVTATAITKYYDLRPFALLPRSHPWSPQSRGPTGGNIASMPPRSTVSVAVVTWSGRGQRSRPRRCDQGGPARQGLRASRRAQPFGAPAGAQRSTVLDAAGHRARKHGQTAEALQSFQRALKIDPNYMAALEGAAQLHYEAGSRRAVPLLNRILQRRPGEPTAHAMLAVLKLPGTASARRRLDTSRRRVR